MHLKCAASRCELKWGQKEWRGWWIGWFGLSDACGRDGWWTTWMYGVLTVVDGGWVVGWWLLGEGWLLLSDSEV